jgi:hypothetical protein
LQATKNELLATFRAELLAQTHTMVRTVVFTNAASVIAVAGIAFAAARLT